MKEYGKNFSIGAFVITALSIIVATLLFLRPSIGNNEQKIWVRFSDIDKITVGTRVLFAGRPVGQVVKNNAWLIGDDAR